MRSSKVFTQFLTLFLTGLMAFVAPVTAQEDPNLAKVDNLLAEAYQAIQKDKTKVAEQKFRKAAQKAESIQDWQGLIDAGYGLAALGKVNPALSFFKRGQKIAKSKKSWQGLVAAGYALSSLPKEKGLLPRSERAFSSAQEIAAQNEDVQGLMEIAKGFQAIGSTGKAAQAQSLANSINQKRGGEARGVKVNPPPGWSAVGKSVRDTDEVPIEAQKLNRASVDQDISNKMTYIREQERLEVERERNKTRLAEAYLYYSGYYRYPGSYFGIRDFGLYGFGFHRLSRSHLHSFASFHLRRYSRHGGFFIRAGRHRFYH